jgi:PTH1 family peptidyl-tRNA hydrolase
VVVGLRNPGSEHAGSRHNVGGEVVTVLARRAGVELRRARRGIRAQVAEGRFGETAALLALPTTFMNEAGQAIAPMLRWYGIEPTGLLVAHDDIDLGFGLLRVQFGRGSGGNNGVRSTIGSLGTRDFWRLRIGVGRPPGRMDPADFVLRPFTRAERPEMDVVVELAADVAEVFLAAGGDAARRVAGDLNVRGRDGEAEA